MDAIGATAANVALGKTCLTLPATSLAPSLALREASRLGRRRLVFEPDYGWLSVRLLKIRKNPKGIGHSLTKPSPSAILLLFLPFTVFTLVRFPLPVAILAITTRINGKDSSEISEPVYGGYANQRGEIFLFGKDYAYGLDLKRQTAKRRPPLNTGAQERYDATRAGESFDFGNRTFLRLSHEQIVAICASNRFRSNNMSGQIFIAKGSQQ